MASRGTQIVWPPVLEYVEMLGEVRDRNGRTTPRDIGRSVKFGDEYYYIFGDTFCFDDNEQFVGVSNNTIAHIPDLTNPRKSEYMYKEPKVPEFVPYTHGEKAYTEREDNKKDNRRIVNWNFGGIIEDRPGSGTGWLFFDKIQTHGGMCEKGFGIGVARVRRDGKYVKVDREDESMVFGDEEPRFGSISPLVDTDGFVYLLGSKDMVNFMARIPLHANFRSRSEYSFLTKSGWKPTYSTIDELEPVLGDQAQGALLKFPYESGFAPVKKPYMWIGVNKWLDSKMWMACAEQIEGPWDIQFLGMAPEVMGKNSGHRYCLYPHLWGSNLQEGKLLITWSDDGVMGGKVAAAVISVKMDTLSEEQVHELQQKMQRQQMKSVVPVQPVVASVAEPPIHQQQQLQQNTPNLEQSVSNLAIYDGASEKNASVSTPGTSDSNMVAPNATSAHDVNSPSSSNNTIQQDTTSKEKHPHLQKVEDKLHLHKVENKLKGLLHKIKD